MANRDKIIRELKELASEVKKLKETHRKRRPIVIEFSGSPKAGKTSSINSLKQFLKRNGFDVEVIQERASRCPVSDKQSPMFNIWTSCMSLAGLVGITEDRKSTCDVVILDRGVFDALCWFEWLNQYNKMEDDFKRNTCDFLLQNEFVGIIDIVFSFTVEPAKSIEREFAPLLTDQTGSIMNLKVLGEYRDAVRKSVETYNKYFNIINIDTSDGNQDEVGKLVTQKTLDTLSDLLDEKIGYINKTDELMSIINSKNVGKASEIEKYLKELCFEKRLQVENNESRLQPIPIVVLTDSDNNKIFVVKKKAESLSKKSTEKNKLLLYVGGHVRNEDVIKGRECDGLQTYKETLQRELKEELGISIALKNIEPIYIYGRGNEEKYHIAICYQCPIQTEGLKFNMDKHELVKNTGTSKSGKFLDISEICEMNDEIEQWSVAILKNFWDIEINSERQISLFD